jgi:undecaprenyl-diphosphatase
MEHLSMAKALILGALQGATEFLPVSSSGHLTIVQWLFGLGAGDGELLAFDVCLHFGTLLAILVVFWREVWQMLVALLTWSAGEEVAPGTGMSGRQARILALLLILGTIPAAVVGPLLDDFFEGLFSNAIAAGAMLLVTGCILWSTRWARDGGVGAGAMTWWRALVVGIAQAVAIIPGISRSGSTIAGGLWVGLSRDFAARFAFLLAIPAIAGASVFEFGKMQHFSREMAASALAGTAVAAVVGFACIKWLLDVVRKGRVAWFAIYCWAVGAATIAYALLKG